MNQQMSFPCDVSIVEIGREPSLGGAISLCAKVAGLAPKEVQDAISADKAQFSRWTDDKEGILWPKLQRLMDACGNDAPVLWMLHARGYDLRSLRRRETETERENRELREQLNRLQQERDIERRLIRDLRLPELNR